MKKKPNPENLRSYATIIIEDLIENNRIQTLIDYLLVVWKHYPQLMKREVLNAKTIQYLNKRVKYEKINVVKFRTKPTLN